MRAYLGLIAGVLVFSGGARADYAATDACAKLTDAEEKARCQRKEIEKLGPLYFSVYEPDGKRHRVRIENIGNPCRDIPKDGEYQIFRDRREMRNHTPFRVIQCKKGEIVASESKTPPSQTPAIRVVPPSAPPSVTIKPPES